MRFRITLKQARKIHHLVRQACCNCYQGNCLLLDDGEPHRCVQIISVHGIYCQYCLKAVLPMDRELRK